MEINNCHSHLVCLLFTLWPFLCLVTFLMFFITCLHSFFINLYIQGVGLASLAHSLLVHGFHLCIYCMESYCVHGTSVPLCSMNNKTMVQRPGVLEISSFTVLYQSLEYCAVHSRHLTSLTTNYTYFRHICNQPSKKLVNSLAFSYQHRRQRRTLGEKLLPPLRFCVQERRPGQAPSPASDVTGKPS